MLLRPNFPAAILPIAILVVISAVGSAANGLETRKLDEMTGESKCGGCPCGKPCTTSYPPPPPSPPPPPPPPPYYKPKPATSYCPPPPFSPPGGSVYLTGPPGSLYPIDVRYNSGGRSLLPAVPVAVVAGLVALFMKW